jgi:hypothetical protein
VFHDEEPDGKVLQLKLESGRVGARQGKALTVSFFCESSVIVRSQATLTGSAAWTMLRMPWTSAAANGAASFSHRYWRLQFSGCA